MDNKKRGPGAGICTAACALIVGAQALWSGAALAQDGQAQLVLGGGSTFAAPLFERWIERYEAEHADIDVEYDAIGSGEGISRFLVGSLDFAATDAPMSPEQEAAIDGGVSHIPVTAGAIVVAYNLPGDQEGELRLPRAILGDIFAGEIRSWNDERIADANPDLDLPKRSITVVARVDGSGTTYAFTNHLNAASPAWQATGLGAATIADWPGTAILGQGNEGVAVNILRGDGTIGYVEYGFASRLGLPMATLENAAGDFVAPAPESASVAIGAADLPDDLKIELPDPQGEGAYPIVTFTWSLLRNQASGARADAAAAFISYAVADGQSEAADLGYVPLPESVQKGAATALAALR